MSIRRVFTVLCMIVCAGILMLGFGNQNGAAQDKDREFLPIVDGLIVDQSPFDGVADGVGADHGDVVFYNPPLGEARAAIEFDLGNTNPNRIQRAILKLTSEGTGVLPGTLTVPVQVNGYLGDGTLDNDLFNAGSFITVFDTFATPDHVPQFIDVTEFLQGIRPSSQRVVGFILRTSTPASINYGSLEEGAAPTLIITLK